MKGTAMLLAVTMLLASCAAQPTRPPQIVSAGGLQYPSQAAANHVEGWVLVSYDVTEDGTVANARVVESEPPGLFDAAALQAVRGWRFNAGVARGKIVATEGVTSKVEFKLGESEAYAR
jgi:TonB family protein